MAQINLTRQKLDRILGIHIDTATVTEIFHRLGFAVTEQAESWQVTVPTYRFDISIGEDLIEGAAEGAGLGIRFLKHLARTRILLHIVDVQPIDGSDPVYNAKAILQELEKFSPTLAKLPIVLVLNKLDQIPEDSREEWCKHILEELQWDGPVFKTSGLMSEGTQQVVYYLMDQIEQQREREVEDPEYAAEMKAFRDQLEAETREQTIAAKETYREMRRQQRLAGMLGDDYFNSHWLEFIHNAE